MLPPKKIKARARGARGPAQVHASSSTRFAHAMQAAAPRPRPCQRLRPAPLAAPPPRRTPRPRSPQTGTSARRSPTPRTRSPRAGTTSPPRCERPVPARRACRAPLCCTSRTAARVRGPTCPWRRAGALVLTDRRMPHPATPPPGPTPTRRSPRTGTTTTTASGRRRPSPTPSTRASGSRRCEDAAPRGALRGPAGTQGRGAPLGASTQRLHPHTTH